jgi:hypothetical protein
MTTDRLSPERLGTRLLLVSRHHLTMLDQVAPMAVVEPWHSPKGSPMGPSGRMILWSA